MDPGHPDHDPRYGPALVAEAEGTARSFPTPTQQAANLARSFWNWATDWFRTASEDEQHRRRAICLDCPEWKDGRCRLCGCIISWKSRIRSEHCPLDPPKW